MRKVPYTEPTSPEWQDWRTRADQARDNQVFKHGDSVPILPLYSERKEDIIRAFHGKCAYCESKIVHVTEAGEVQSQTQPGEVAHFRPKGRVTDENGKRVRYLHDGKEYDHPGYYWLAYEWRNLLLACATCNRPEKKIGKWDKFPVTGHRAFAPGEEVNEVALLLNPMDEDYQPEEHFTFDPKTGILGLSSAQAQKCDDIFRLNQRGLPEARRELYTSVRSAFFEVLEAHKQHTRNQEAEERIRRAREGKTPYTFAALIAIRDVQAEIQAALELLNG